MKRFNICTKKVYSKDGQERAQWNIVGFLIYFPANGDKQAGFKMELNMWPTVPFFVFEQKPKEVKPVADPLDMSVPSEEISPDSIPF
jgi:hypothetical protein